VKGRIILFIFAFIIWVALSWLPDTPHLIIGLLVAALVAILTRDLFPKRIRVLFNPVRYWYLCFIYVPVFLWECLKANLDVAYRVLHPGLPIHPGIVRIRTELKTDLARTLLANSITLTPGTMTVDIDKDRGYLYIHWIDVKATDDESATKHIGDKFEYILREILE